MIFSNASQFNKKSVLILIFFLCFCLKSNAQNTNNIDSIIAVIESSTNDSLIGQKYIELGRAYIQTDMKKAFESFDKAIKKIMS